MKLDSVKGRAIGSLLNSSRRRVNELSHYEMNSSLYISHEM